VCSECGCDCTVPFQPDPHRPVYCPACWRKRKPRGNHRSHEGALP
jgi:CxxC-x17-CxxC domain-containing protein